MERIFALTPEQLSYKLKAAGVEALQQAHRLSEGLQKRYHEAKADKLDTMCIALTDFDLLRPETEESLIASYRELIPQVEDQIKGLKTLIHSDDESRVIFTGEIMASYTLLEEIQKMGIYSTQDF
jgi:hypothetical protein